MNPADLEAFYIQLGKHIRDARMKADISQDVLAQQLGLTRASIVNIEKGRQRPMIHTILELAVILNTNFNSLIPGASNNSVEKRQTEPAGIVDDFANIISDEFNLDIETQDAVKRFVTHVKN